MYTDLYGLCDFLWAPVERSRTSGGLARTLVFFYRYTAHYRTELKVGMKKIDFGGMGVEMVVFETSGDREPTIVDVTP